MIDDDLRLVHRAITMAPTHHQPATATLITNYLTDALRGKHDTVWDHVLDVATETLRILTPLTYTAHVTSNGHGTWKIQVPPQHNLLQPCNLITTPHPSVADLDALTRYSLALVLHISPNYIAIHFNYGTEPPE